MSTRAFSETHPYKLSTGKEGAVWVHARFGRARGYPNGLRRIMFKITLERRAGSYTYSVPFRPKEWTEFLSIFEPILVGISKRLGVSFRASEKYQGYAGIHDIEFHPRVLPKSENLIVFRCLR